MVCKFEDRIQLIQDGVQGLDFVNNEMKLPVPFRTLSFVT